MITLALGGNPNCGKSALFNQLTGIRQTTGNWPGVTVERKEGRTKLLGKDAKVVDLPGIYSLDAASLDEKVTRDYLLSLSADLIVNVVDASNLERNLYFSVQLREMGIPVVIALNMMDVARKRGIKIDVERLSASLCCPVVPIVAVTGECLSELAKAIQSEVSHVEPNKEPIKERRSIELVHESLVEDAILAISSRLPDSLSGQQKRWVSTKLLEDDQAVLQQFDLDVQLNIQPRVESWQEKISERSGEDADMHIADARYNHAHVLAQSVQKDTGRVDKTMSDKIDQLVLSKRLGLLIFMLVMYAMFTFTINIGGAFIDLFDLGVGALLVEWPIQMMTDWGWPDWAQVFIANGIGGGVQVVSTFIPIIVCLYLFLSALEDSGYMARAAFVMDRGMRKIGLPGKAFVPMIVGFGCNVPAVMATRTLENQRERKLTILMNPFMSCGARLPVYVLFAAAFFPENGQNLVFGLYLAGIAVAVLTGLVMRKTLLKGESSGFMMELPPYHVPTLKGVLLRTWDRVKLFIRDAGKVIVVMVLALNVLNSIGTDGSFGNEDSEDSVLSATSKTLTPLFAPMGIQEENWPATVGIFTGVLAKEAVVGTLDSLYGQLASNGAQAEEGFKLSERLFEALQTVPENLSAVGGMLLDPLGLDVGDISSVDTAAEEQEVSHGTFGEMINRFEGQAGAFAYLLFILLYFPCVATIGAIVRETDRAWAGFVALWTTGVAYCSASAFYQLATFNAHPLSSSVHLALLSAFMLIVVLLLRRQSEVAPDRQGFVRSGSISA
jgi:ferrous iron transport protein B